MSWLRPLLLSGISQTEKAPLHQTPESVLRAVVNTNLLGTMLGCKVALEMMLQWPGRKCHVFNMEGAGARGNATPNSAAYGATKAAFRQLMKSLVKETSGTNVGVHTISPGMVLTDLLLSNRELKALRIFNILAERPHTVAQWLVPRIRAVRGSGRYIPYLTGLGAAWRFATYFKRKDRFFDSQGNPTQQSQ
jgi:chlorophyll(ide) b reductase